MKKYDYIVGIDRSDGADKTTAAIVKKLDDGTWRIVEHFEGKDAEIEAAKWMELNK